MAPPTKATHVIRGVEDCGYHVLGIWGGDVNRDLERVDGAWHRCAVANYSGIRVLVENYSGI